MYMYMVHVYDTDCLFSHMFMSRWNVGLCLIIMLSMRAHTHAYSRMCACVDQVCKVIAGMLDECSVPNTHACMCTCDIPHKCTCMHAFVHAYLQVGTCIIALQEFPAVVA